MQVNYEPWKIVREEKEHWGIRVLDQGKFENLTLAINDVAMSDDDGVVTLDYDIVYSLTPPEELEKDAEFKDLVSFVIQDILVKAMNEHENRKRNSQQSSNG